MAKSLPDISQKVIADASGLVNEMNRADNATRRSAARMDAEVDKLTKSIKRKFSVSEIGKGVLSGLGIGSGFAIAQAAADQLTSYFQRQAEHAKAIEESTAKQLDYTRQIIALRQTDAQKQITLEKEFARVGKELEAARAPKTQQVPLYRLGMQVGTQTVPVNKTNEEIEAIHKLSEEYARLGVEIEKANRKTADKAESDKLAISTSDQTRKIAALSVGLKQQEDAFDALLKKQQESNEASAKTREEAEKLAERYRDIADPLRQYRQQIEDVNRLHADGKLKANEAADAIARIQKSAVEVGLNDFFGDMDKMARATNKTNELAKDLGFSFSSAFEDAIISGNKLSDVLDGLIQDVIRLFIRQSITMPAANWLTGAFAGIGFGGARAGGGGVTSGKSYLVGEQGPELFVPSGGGTIVPNDKLSGRAGNTYIIDARGTDESAIQRLQQALFALAGPGVVERRAMTAHVSTLRRGGGPARALA